MKRYQFRTDIVVEGTAYKDGEIDDEENIPAGHLENLIRQGQVRELSSDEPTDAEGIAALTDQILADTRSVETDVDAIHQQTAPEPMKSAPPKPNKKNK